MRHILVVLVLFALILAVYWPVRGFEFVNYDDDVYLTENSRFNDGLSWSDVEWAFTTGYHSNWHPLTWLSYFADYAVYGMNAGGFHLTNLAFHILNCVLLYIVLWRLTSAPIPAAVAAILFAIHPLRVEAVAWVSERKELLATFFGLLTIWAYSGYAKSGRKPLYVGAASFFALGLMAKPMLVTLPCALLLLDYWPLNRLKSRNDLARLGAEKIPLFMLSGVSAVVTYLVQQSGGAVKSGESYSIATRLVNGAAAYLSYLKLTFWPINLAPFYPYPQGGPPISLALLSVLVIAAISAWAIRIRRRSPYILIGWLWFLGTLVPVIGLVQVGEQAYADRYTYLPHIGLLIGIVWAAFELVKEHAPLRRVAAACAAAILAGLCIQTFNQVWIWRDSEAMWRHALAVNDDNYVAHNNLAMVLRQRDFESAERHFRTALDIRTDYYDARVNLGNVYLQRQAYEDAVRHYLAAVEASPNSYLAYANLGLALTGLGRLDEALEALKQSLNLAPSNPRARAYLGDVLLQQKNYEHAALQYRYALQGMPERPDVRTNLAVALIEQRKAEEALDELQRVLELNPDHIGALYNTGVAWVVLGRYERARTYFERVLVLEPGHEKARRSLTAVNGAARGSSGVNQPR